MNRKFLGVCTAVAVLVAGIFGDVAAGPKENSGSTVSGRSDGTAGGVAAGGSRKGAGNRGSVGGSDSPGSAVSGRSDGSSARRNVYEATSDIEIKKSVELAVEFYDGSDNPSTTLKSMKIYKDDGTISDIPDRQVKFSVNKLVPGTVLAIGGLKGLNWGSSEQCWKIVSGRNKVGLKFSAGDAAGKSMELSPENSLDGFKPGVITVTAGVVQAVTDIVEDISVTSGIKISVVTQR